MMDGPIETAPELEVPAVEYGFHIYDMDSGESQSIDIPGGYLAWLPSGDFLLSMTESLRADGQLFRLGAEGGDPALVTPQRGWFAQMDGSRDGNLLLVSIGRSVAEQLTSQIVEIDVTTGAVQEVTSVGGWGSSSGLDSPLQEPALPINTGWTSQDVTWWSWMGRRSISARPGAAAAYLSGSTTARL